MESLSTQFGVVHFLKLEKLVEMLPRGGRKHFVPPTKRSELEVHPHRDVVSEDMDVRNEDTVPWCLLIQGSDKPLCPG